MTKTIFNYPDKFFGFCSGWNKDFEPDGRYTITKRIPVNLDVIDAEFVGFFEDNEKRPPMLVKKPQHTNYLGLSSGAGSSLFEFNNEIFKIKRNGFFNDAFTFKPFLDSGIDAYLETIVESSIILNYRGVLVPEKAEREIKAINTLRKEGLCDAYDPIGFFTYSLPSKLSENNGPIAGASLMKVSSDVRVDEFIFALLSELLNDSIEKGNISYDFNENVFLANKFSVSDFFKVFNSDYKEIFYSLGKTIGSYYAYFHARGHLRGYLNAWFGNEIINPDGSLSLIDLDFSIMHPKFSKEDIEDLQKLEYSQARGAFSGEFESMFLHCFGFVGYHLGKGFDDGYYNTNTPLNISKQIVDKAVSNIIKYSDNLL